MRGFLEGQRSGNRGYMVSAEGQFPLMTRADSTLPGDRLKGFAFLDHGAAFPTRGNNQGRDSDDYLTSVGGGVMVSFTPAISGRVALGIPVDVRPPDYRRWVLHVYLQAVVF